MGGSQNQSIDEVKQNFCHTSIQNPYRDYWCFMQCFDMKPKWINTAGLFLDNMNISSILTNYILTKTIRPDRFVKLKIELGAISSNDLD